MSSANSTGKDDRLIILSRCLELAEKARRESRRVGGEKDGRIVNLEGLLRTAIDSLDEHQVSHLPRAPQLPPIPDLAPTAQRPVPTRIIDLGKLMPISPLRPPRRAFSGGTAFLVAGTIAAVSAGYFVVASWPPAMDFAEAPSSASGETRPAPLSPLPQAILPSGSEAAPEPQLTMRSEDKPTKNGIEPSLPQSLSATEYGATAGETSATQSAVHEASPRSSAPDTVLDAPGTKPLIEKERQLVATSVHVSTCFPSASAVRQDHPEAWPSWTLRAPGYEGTKCWYAASRPTAGAHRGETTAKKDAVGTIEER
jgi:hypothetical protein